MGRYEESIGLCRQVLQIDPKNLFCIKQLIHAYHSGGMYEHAMDQLRLRTKLRDGREAEEALSRAYDEGGYQEAWRVVAERVQELKVPTPVAVATPYLRAGEYELALDWLERGYEMRDPDLPYVGLRAEWDVLRDRPRYQDLMRRMNLPRSQRWSLPTRSPPTRAAPPPGL